MGKCPLIPNTLPEKRLEAPLTTATLASVPIKNSTVQSDVSTFTSTVVTTNTSRITKRDDRIRTFEDNLPTPHRHTQTHRYTGIRQEFIEDQLININTKK